jgi:mannose-1-phosphate guanylyltransferase
MAGGSGTRFWPKSREQRPKQLLNIVGPGTMLQNTVERLRPLMPARNIFVIATRAYAKEIAKQLPDLPSTNLLIEPIGKNTAPCIGLGAIYLRRLDPDGVMAVLPSDHLIEDNETFLSMLRAGEQIARTSDSLVTIGIKPTHPATGYGYIQFGASEFEIDGISAHNVKTFAEKPDRETAELFLRSGDFLWNSGIFIWKASTILSQIEELQPQMYDGLKEIDEHLGEADEQQTIDRVYRQIKSISIDYGIMEGAKNVVVLPATFLWNDLGSWDEVYKLQAKDGEQNAALTPSALLDCHGCLVDAPDRIVAAIGLKDLAVINTADALLICPRERAQEVKDLVELLRRRKLNQVL